MNALGRFELPDLLDHYTMEYSRPLPSKGWREGKGKDVPKVMVAEPVVGGGERSLVVEGHVQSKLLDIC